MSQLEQFRAALAARLKRISSDRKAVKKLLKLIEREKNKHRTISKAGANFIASFEGYSSTPTDKLDGYSTVGIGHLIAHRPVNAADRVGVWVKGQQAKGYLTRAEAIRLLQHDLEKTYVPAVQALFIKGGPLHGHFTQPRFDSLVSFVYNLGIASVGGVTGFETIGRAIRSADIKAIADAFLLYDNGPNGPLPGLTRRRRCERRLFLSGNYSTSI